MNFPFGTNLLVFELNFEVLHRSIRVCTYQTYILEAWAYGGYMSIEVSIIYSPR